MGRFLFPEAEGSLVATYVVFSIASRFWSDILVRERRPDIDEIPRKLASKGETQRAELVRRVLNTLIKEAVTLESLPLSEVRRMLGKVQDLHSEAYDWHADVDLDGVLGATKHARLRTKIRYMLEYLDLKYLYGEEPSVEARDPDEAFLNEGPGEAPSGAHDEPPEPTGQEPG